MFKKIMIFCGLFLSINLYAQKNINSIYDSIIDSSVNEKEKIKQIELLLIKNNSKNNNDLAILYYNFSKLNWLGINDELKAIKYAKKANEIFSKSKNIDSIIFKKNLYNLGIFYYKKSTPNYANALRYFDNLIVASDKFESIASMAFRKKGDIYGDLGDFQRAIENYENSERILKKLDLKENLLETYISVSGTYAELNDQTFGELFFKNQIKIDSLAKKWEFTKEQKIKLLLNKGNVYLTTSKYDLALKSYTKGLKLAEEVSDSLRVFSFLNGIGLVYKKKKEYTKAIQFYNQSKKYMLNNRYLISVNFDNKASLFLAKNDYENALLNFDKAISSLLPDRKINSSKQLLPIDVIKMSPYKKDILDYLIEKANALVDYSNKTSNKKFLKDAEKTFALADEIIDLLFLDSSESLSKLFWRKRAANLYFNAVKICYLLNKPKRAIYYIEKNKGLLLIENRTAYKAKQLAKIPLNVSEKEDEYIASINKIKSELMNYNYSDKQLDSIRNRLFSKKGLFKKFIDSLDNVYPKYFNLKKQLNIITVNNIQKKITENTLVFEYIFGNNSGYAILLTKNNIEFKKLENVSELMKNITLYKKQISTPFLTTNQKKAFQNNSNQLFLNLFPFENIEKKIDNKKLIIIADGNLQHIPFEALVVNKDINLESSYLLQYCDINYKYSLSLEMQLNLKPTEKRNSFVGFIPSTFNHSNLTNLDNNLVNELAISSLFKNNIFTKKQATKKTFLKAYNQHDILHISTHGGVENDVPWLAFYDQKLYLDELYFLKNQKELVVLSACKTADGKLQKGEGLYNLTRGFINSGTKSVLSTLWNVNEKSSSEIINEFYKNISEHKTKSVALKNAKCNYIAKYKNTSQASPYYWSAIILTGNNDAILVPKFSWHYLVFSVLLLIALFIYFRRKKRTY